MACQFMFYMVQIMVASTTLFLAAGRFGLAPTVNRATSAGLKFQDREGGVKSADPSGEVSLSPALV
jgi:photosystem I reaction center PsaK